MLTRFSESQVPKLLPRMCLALGRWLRNSQNFPWAKMEGQTEQSGRTGVGVVQENQ